MGDSISHSIYALPIPTASNLIRNSSRGKRKRSRFTSTEEQDKTDNELEYSAVITPEERAQRRLAGYALNLAAPSAPFPHAPSLGGRSRLDDKILQEVGEVVVPIESRFSSSLRNTHLGVMVAILHRSLEQKEYIRAAKAIAIILRTEVSGKSIDIRHAGLWGIGAEILVRNHAVDRDVSRTGFNQARILYNKLALQHPWHRSWPNVVNAQDFKLAMFDLWVYTVCTESKRIKEQDIEADESESESESESGSSNEKELRAKRWELGEADAIGKEMDLLMGSIPFVDHLELIRLRAMVALWTADLLDAVDVLSVDNASENSLQERTLYGAWSGDDDTRQNNSMENSKDKAATSRRMAQRLFVKIGVYTDGASAQEDEEEDDTDMIH